MRARLAITAFAALGAAAGCGKSQATTQTPRPPQPLTATAPTATAYPAAATQNTTRIASRDPVTVAAAAAQIIYTSIDGASRPRAVVLVDRRDWRAGIAASVLTAAPLRAPVLLTDGDRIPAPTRAALARLRPRGAPELHGAQVIRIGDAPAPEGLRSVRIRAHDDVGIDGAIAMFAAALNDRPPRQVMIASADRPGFAAPAAGLAAWSGVPVLLNAQDALSPQTRAALTALNGPRSYVIGPVQAIGPQVVRALRPIGSVVRVTGRNPVGNSVSVARYRDDRFGWGAGKPGHGLVFVPAATDPQLATASAALSTSGDYGPLILLGDAELLDPAVENYLRDIRPDGDGNPAHGVYNHAWIVGDEGAISPALQARIDRLLEIKR